VIFDVWFSGPGAVSLSVQSPKWPPTCAVSPTQRTIQKLLGIDYFKTRFVHFGWALEKRSIVKLNFVVSTFNFEAFNYWHLTLNECIYSIILSLHASRIRYHIILNRNLIRKPILSQKSQKFDLFQGRHLCSDTINYWAFNFHQTGGSTFKSSTLPSLDNSLHILGLVLLRGWVLILVATKQKPKFKGVP
jgi:hypothetical protein